jgi:hypothetical protein
MNFNARILKENRLRKAKAEKQIISRGCARGSYDANGAEDRRDVLVADLDAGTGAVVGARDPLDRPAFGH